jgi:hypothetical protein
VARTQRRRLGGGPAAAKTTLMQTFLHHDECITGAVSQINNEKS